MLSICGIDELGDFTARSVTHLLSILDPGFPEPETLSALTPRSRLDLRFHDIIEKHEIMTAPCQEDVERLLQFGSEIGLSASAAGHLLVHCHAGISRSTASMIILVAQARPALAAEDVVAEVVRIRPRAWPNLRIVEIGDRLLGRRGELAAALEPQYRAIAERQPEFIRLLVNSGRAREVPADLR